MKTSYRITIAIIAIIITIIMLKIILPTQTVSAPVQAAETVAAETKDQPESASDDDDDQRRDSNPD